MALDPGLAANLSNLFSLIERNVRLEDSDPPVQGVTVGIRPGQREMTAPRSRGPSGRASLPRVRLRRTLNFAGGVTTS